MKHFVALLVLLATSENCLAGPWSELAVKDLEKIQQLVSRNHPGLLDKQNKWFNEWFKNGYTEAISLAKKANTYQGYFYAIKFFVNGFRDGHLYYWADLTINLAEWPGFIIAKRGRKFVVHHVFEGAGFDSLPKIGAQLVGCDTSSVESLMEQNVFPYDGNVDLEAHWIKQAPLLLVSFGNPFIKKIEKCAFKSSENEKPQTLALTWRLTQFKNIEEFVEKASFGSHPTNFVHRQFGKDKHWISIPTFSPEGSDASQLEKIIANLNKLRQSNIIVFDVRGNGGGNSQWGDNIIKKLFGESYKSYRDSLKPDKSYVEWRTSPENLAYLQKVLPGLKERFGLESSIYSVFNAVAQKMAKGRGHELLREPSNDTAQDTPITNQKPASLVKAKIYFLTDGHCGSACLDFADKLLNMEGVTHIGLPTSADTVYMDVRRESLPSAIGNLSFAMKVYRDRLRGNNEPYIPTFRWDGDIWDTSKLEKWIVEISRL